MAMPMVFMSSELGIKCEALPNRKKIEMLSARASKLGGLDKRGNSINCRGTVCKLFP